MRRLITSALMAAGTVIFIGGIARAQDPSLVGLWEVPVHPLENGSEISCSDIGNDEIGHVTLIPVGEHKGRLLVWTRFDNRAARETPPFDCPYKSYVLSLSLSGWEVVESMSFR